MFSVVILEVRKTVSRNTAKINGNKCRFAEKRLRLNIDECWQKKDLVVRLALRGTFVPIYY